VQVCAATCSAIEDCRAFEWTNVSTTPFPYTYSPIQYYTTCFFSAEPYNASFLRCGAAADSQTVSLSVYSMTNWKQPKSILQNGGFETGCFFPWQNDIEVGNATDFYTEVVPCDKSIKGDCIEGDYYAHLYGGTPGVPKYENPHAPDAFNFLFTLYNWPVTQPGINYTVTMWVKGVNGTGRFEPTNGLEIFEIDPTGKWQQIETWFVGRWGNTLYIEIRDEYVIDWYIDDVQVFESKT
jgi:hypothetical protein